MNRRGSALLIVLGMLAFMIVSAVGFSAYMRYARLPSSFLRRSGASRMFAKAALARAIDAVDMAIGNNPHPGIGTAPGGNGIYDNIWVGRVFVGKSGLSPDSIAESDTIPVLTLEALAYVPPPLINEVRYYSRHTPTAGWGTFEYDAGRYAFCAVDVSDYLDINRMFANKPRNSTANGRLSLSYLFENADHSAGGSGADRWDEFMEKFRDVGQGADKYSINFTNRLPLVSLADFNLALNAYGKIGNLYSPFCDHVWQDTGDFYMGGGGSGGDPYEFARRMTFVTDSYFPSDIDPVVASGSSGTDAETFDLAHDQPFPPGAGGPHGTVALEDFMNATTQLGRFLRTRISSLGLAALYDYLDEDSVPVSLVIPTTERVPMICGIQNQIGDGSTLQVVTEWVEAGDPKSATYKGLIKADEGDYCVVSGDKTTEKRTVCRTIRCTVKGLQDALTKGVRAATVYPFAHEDDPSEISFSVDGRVALFFTMVDELKPMTTRLGSANAEQTARWSLSRSDFAEKKGVENGVVSVPLTKQAFDLPTTVDSQADVVQPVALLCRDAMQIDLSEENPFLIFTRVWTQTYNPDTGAWSDDDGVDMNTAPIREIRSGLPPLRPDGSVYDGFAECGDNAADYAGKSVKLNVAVWLRVIEESGNKVYDMVPASPLDDEEFNGVTGGGPTGSSRILENTFPLMRFETGVSFPLDPETLAAGGEALQQKMSLTQSTVMVADPRFNYAPESWFASTADLSPENWLAAIRPALDDGDGDIFMSVSDQGYMQSVYELGFIPGFTDLVDAGAGGSSLRGYCQKASDAGIVQFETDPASTLNYGMMWRTYDPLEPDEARRMRELNIYSGLRGQKINPYSDSTNVWMAALANTPVDWRCASTNNVESLENMSADEFNSQYAWNEYSSGNGQKMYYEDLEHIAGGFITSMRGGDWETAWDNADWLGNYTDENNDSFLGVTLDSGVRLWGVDRKFLYGYWRECVAPRQQLFLIFVRAEPFMMGGEGINQASPQLGARAVALVWRDPEPNNSSYAINGYPHRTRVLFYRQFD